MLKPKRQCKERTCFVPLCRSGYRSNKENVSLFTAPVDSARLAEWEKNIKRADRKLTPAAVVCEKHFESSCIERSFQITVNGVMNELAREKPRLKPDAVPTVFNDYPTHLVPKKTPKRKARNICDQEPASRKRKRDIELADRELGSAVDNARDEGPADFTGASEELQESSNSQQTCLAAEPVCDNEVVPKSPCGSETQHPFDGILIPVTWMKLPAALDGTVSYARCETEANNFSALFIERMVTFGRPLLDEGSVIATVYFRGREKGRRVLAARHEAEALIKESALPGLCNGCGMVPVAGKHTLYRDMYFAEKCLLTTDEKGESCVHCRYLRKLSQNNTYRRKKTKDPRSDKKKCKNVSRALRRTKKSLANAQQQVSQMKEQNMALSEEAVEAKIQSLPEKQQLAVRTCFLAARRKSLRGITYDDEWIVECLMMRMRSPKLYEYLRKQCIMVLPGRSCLQKYLKRFKGGFGLNPKVFTALSEKTKSMDSFSRHGGLLVDEIKLSEHLNVKAAGNIEGFVDLGDYTDGDHKGVLADHGMVVLFQPFTGNWTQILGVFAAKGNVKAATLAKIIVECTIRAEQAGLYVDSVTCDGAAWNRSMWRMFGIHGSATHLRSSTKHPVDPARQLFFVSDFPHLVKNMRNGFVSKGYLTPSGHVHSGVIETAWDSDRDSVTLKAMPNITSAHLKPNSFEKMKVNLAFQLFGDQVIKGLHVHRKRIDYMYKNVQPTEEFIKRMNRLIRVMTSRTSQKALKPGSWDAKFLQDFLCYLDEWEQHAKPAGGGFLTDNTACGLRVTIRSTLDLLSYLTSTVGYKYFLTSRLSQDKLENLFGIVRHSSGCNDHPTVTQFLVTVNLMSFYNLAKPPRGTNCPPDVVKALLSTAPSSPSSTMATPLLDVIDDLFDHGKIDEVEATIDRVLFENDHAAYVEKKSNAALIYYTAGYVARKTIAKNECPGCAASLCVTPNDASRDVNSQFTAHFDNGGLVYPSSALSTAVKLIEDAFTVFFSKTILHEESLLDFARRLRSLSLPQLGCLSHEKEILANVVKFYVLLRFRFFVKGLNKERDGQRQRQKLLKLRRCQ